MQYKDYYKIMGIERDATQDEIKRAYRKLARKYHPDVSKDADAESRFKEVNEANAVLKDPEKRAAYDQLGAQARAGSEFQPPPDWASGFEFSGSGFGEEGAGAYSDFFESLFGQQQAYRSGPERNRDFKVRGEDHHAKVLIDLEDSYRGGQQSIRLRGADVDANGHVVTRDRTLSVNIPKGVRQGQRIRLSGQGSPGTGGGAAGDLYLEVQIRPHKLYTVDDRDVHLALPITPWEAELGATVKAPTPVGPVDLKVPDGTKSGRKLRLKGRGIPATPPGDFYVTAVITLPPANSESAKEMYLSMQKDFDYNPRGNLGV